MATKKTDEAPEDKPAKTKKAAPKSTSKTEDKAEAKATTKKAESAEEPEEPAPQADAPDEKPAPKEHKERTFVDAKTGKTISHPHQGGTGAATKAVRDEMHAERKGAALPFRIGAIVLWALGIACEVMAILVMNGTLFLPGFPKTTWLIVWIVLDLVLVVIGSQLWKHANHVSPASKENKLAYWVQTELGVIIAAIAFAPVIILLLTNKDLDKKTKQVGSIVAAVALVAAVASGIDYHPATQEDLDQAEAGAAVLSDDGLAYWTPFGEVYHFNPDCQYIKNSSTIYAGSVQEALDGGRTRGCSGCTVEDGTDVLGKADPAAVAAAAANAIKIGGEPDGDADADAGSADEPQTTEPDTNADETEEPVELPKAA